MFPAQSVDFKPVSGEMSGHGGVPSDHAERALGHVLGGVRGVYDVHEYREEKKRALATLAAELERVLNPGAKVIALASRR
jgi:hypothetical protein